MRSFAALLSFVLGFGCASKPPAKTPLASTPSPASSGVEGESAVDLSPVTMPDDVIGVGRLARPRAFVETLANWSGFPLHLTDVLPSDAQFLNQVVAWDAPVEAAAVLNRHSTEKAASPEYVVSVGLTSLNAALAAAKDKGYEATRVSPSVYRVPLSDEAFCAIAAAAGATPARAVCSKHWQDIEDLLAYATRGLPREDFGGKDLYLALKPAPLQQRYAQEISSLPLFVGIGLRQIQTDSPRLDRALADASYGVAGELKTIALQLDGFEVSARVDDSTKSLDFGYSFGFTKDDSFVAQLFQDAGRRSSAPTETFWDLPRTANAGNFFVGFDAKRLATLFTPLGEITDAFLEQHKAAPTYKNRWRSVFDSLPILFAGTSRVAGTVPPAKELTPQSFFTSSIGWNVGVAETPADKVFKLMTDLEALVADRETQKLLKELLPKETVPLPKIRHKVVKVNGFAARATEFIGEVPMALLEKLAEKRGLPKGMKDSKKPVTFALLVVPDGERTYYSFAADEKVALTALEGARAGRDGKLRENPELARLKDKPAIGVGFSSLEAIFSSLASLARASNFDSEGALARAPNHGRSPWTSRVEEVPHGSGLRVSANVSVPQGAFQDIAGVLPALISMFGKDSVLSGEGAKEP